MPAAAAASHLAESTPTAAHLMPLLQSRAKAPISDPRCSALQRFLRAAPIPAGPAPGFWPAAAVLVVTVT